MSNYNKVIIMGRLTRDPELKYLPSGAAVVQIGLATSHTYTDRQSGEKKEDVCFVDAVAFNRTAEVINEYLRKGRPVLIEGRLRYQTWETDDGQKRSKHDIFIERFSFVSDGQGAGEGGGQARSQSASASGHQGTTANESQTTEDDIPF